MCTSCDFEDFIFNCKALKERMEEINNDSDKWHDFSSGVLEKITDMREWVEKEGHVTDKMKKALENMEHGVDRWDR